MVRKGLVGVWGLRPQKEMPNDSSDMGNLQFEKDKVCYEQNFEMFRSLNQLMWQVPMIAITITGGLWFGAGTVNDIAIKTKIGLLTLPFIANIGLIIVLFRIRFVMGEYLESFKKFNPGGYVAAQGQSWYNKPRVVVSVFSLILGISAIMSLVGAIILLSGGKI